MLYIHPATHKRALASILIVRNLLLSTTKVVVGLASPSLTPIRFLSPPTTATATATGPPFSAARHQAHREGEASTLVRPTTEPRLPRPPKVCQRRHSRSEEEEEAPSASTNHHHHHRGERDIDRKEGALHRGRGRERESIDLAFFPQPASLLIRCLPRQRYVCVPPSCLLPYFQRMVDRGSFFPLTDVGHTRWEKVAARATATFPIARRTPSPPPPCLCAAPDSVQGRREACQPRGNDRRMCRLLPPPGARVIKPHYSPAPHPQ